MTNTASGWRWVVLVACFLSVVINSTFYYAFGTFVLYWMEAFSATAASVAAVTSSGSAIASMACPFGCFFVQKWGCRWTHVIGGVMLMMSFLASSFAQTLSQLFIMYSIVGGLGCCFCMVSFVNVVVEHFQDQRPLAFALVSSGYGLGSFIFPLYFESLIKQYSWRGAMLITSGVFGNLIVCGLLMYSTKASPALPALCCFKNNSTEGRGSSTEGKNPNQSRLEKDKYIFDKLPDEFFFRDNEESTQVIRKLLPVAKDENDNINLDIESLKNIENDINPDIEADEKELSYFQISKRLMSNSTFYIVIIHNILLFMGYFIVLGLTTVRASYDLNLSEEQAAQIVSTFGINSIFRIFLGLLSKWNIVKSYHVYFTCFTFTGILTLLSVLATSFTTQIIYGLCCGVLFAANTHYQVLVYEIYGAVYFNVAFGYLEFMHGIGIVTGPIIGGILFDVTGSTVWTFLFAGATMIVASFLLPIGLALTGNLKKLNF